MGYLVIARSTSGGPLEVMGSYSNYYLADLANNDYGTGTGDNTAQIGDISGEKFNIPGWLSYTFYGQISGAAYPA